MTRLTEALERAQFAPAVVPPDQASASVPADAVTGTWQFDVHESPAKAAAIVAPPRPDAVTSTAPAGFRFPPEMAGKLVVSHTAAAGLIEQYRRLAAVLHHAQTERGVRSVMIASAVAAEGKTLTATNLALTLSQSFDRRVLLIDADLRRPALHEMFRLPNEQGLVDSLRRPDGGRLPVQAVAPNLWVLTAGRPTSDPMSGLVSTAMKQLLADAAEQFDWVIVDTPPVALMPDANLLAGMVDTALLVISANTTPYPLVQRAAASLGTSRLLGVVLNRASQAALEQEYGYYGNYERAPRVPATGRRRRVFGLFGK
jgi:protein-tyrosine kinase